MAVYLKYCYASKKGNYRENNEDNLYVCGKWLQEDHVDDAGVKVCTSPNGLFGVFDGLGGELKGEVASLLAAQTLHTVSDLSEYFKAANDAITSIEREGKKKVASTAAVLQIEDNKFMASNLGDSRIYLLRDGKVRQLTLDHTMAETMISAGVMTREETQRNSFHNYLTQCLGGAEDETDELAPHYSDEEELMENDVFILCSDGLWGALSDEELLEGVKTEGKNPAETMAELAYKNGAKDNVTILIVYVHNKPFMSMLKDRLMSN